MIRIVLPEGYRLDLEEKTRWVEALRSGKYSQGQKYLKAGVGFCCLGVRLDLIDPSAWNEAWEAEGWGADGDEVGLPVNMCYDGDTDYSEMPFEVTEEIVKRFPWIRNLFGGTKTSLAEINDRGATFEQIADIIEYRF